MIRSVIVAGAALGLAATVAACASGPSGSSASTSGGITTIPVGVLVNAQITPYWIANTDGFAKANHIHFQLVTVAPNLGTQALSSGSVDFLPDQAANYLQAVQASDPVVAVEATDEGVPVDLILSEGFVKAKGITTSTPLTTVIHDMIGSKGGLSSVTTTGQANILLRSYGVQPSQVTEAQFSTPGAVEVALQKDQVDWFVTGAPIPYELQSKGYGLVVADRQNADGWKTNVYGEVMVTTQSFASSNPKLVGEAVKAIQQATAYMNEHTSATLKVMGENLTGLSTPVLQNALQSSVWLSNGAMNQSTWNTTINFNVQQNVVKSGLQVTEDTDWTNKYVPAG